MREPWGFTAQRPARRATERRDEVVRAWLERTYPAIARKAKAQGCEIQWADETGLSSRANYGRSFAPRGHTPVIRRPGKRFSQSMISSLTNQGKLRFMVYEGALKAPIFLNFLQRLIREAARKLFVIVDNLPVHRAHRVTAWVQNNADRIELFYLPSYSYCVIELEWRGWFCAVRYSTGIATGWLRGRRSDGGASSRSSWQHVVRDERAA